MNSFDNNDLGYKDEIDILELLFNLWNRKFFISCITFLGTLIALLYSLYLPNIYNKLLFFHLNLLPYLQIYIQ